MGARKNEVDDANPHKFATPFSINTPDPLHLPYNIQTPFLYTTISTEIVNITGKLVKRSQGLCERYRNELAKLDRPERWELVLEVAKLTQEQAEQISFAAQVQKEPAEEFLRELAMFSEKHVDWAAAKLILETSVQEQLAAKKTKKVAWLTSHDIVNKAISDRCKVRRKKALAAAAQPPNVDLKNIDKELPGSEAVVEPQGLSKEVRIDKGKGREVDAGEAKDTEAASNPRKHKRATNEIEKRRKYQVDISVINLDIEEGVEELKREALGEEEKDEALVVEQAVRVLFQGMAWPDKETA
ncbi:hypothetical protein BGX38DRAFT_1272269 [Terfezia claveryi]|nr:hypothetical protein BGX38DRAFT_1272269 [Terfezia claveryi]